MQGRRTRAKIPGSLLENIIKKEESIMKRILIGCPVRNRAWILPEYLRHIESLEYPKEFITCCFIINDSADKTKDILSKWQSENYSKYESIKIIEINFGNGNDMGESGYGRQNDKKKYACRKKVIIPTLAILRNRLLEEAREGNYDYFFSIDSDILVNPDILNKLIETGKGIVAGLVHNGEVEYNFLQFSGKSRKFLPDKLFEVKTTGAVVLISSKVFNNENIQYGNNSKGEDVDFCESARQQGFKSYVLTEIQEHILNRRARTKKCVCL